MFWLTSSCSEAFTDETSAVIMCSQKNLLQAPKKLFRIVCTLCTLSYLRAILTLWHWRNWNSIKARKTQADNFVLFGFWSSWVFHELLSRVEVKFSLQPVNEIPLCFRARYVEGTPMHSGLWLTLLPVSFCSFFSQKKLNRHASIARGTPKARKKLHK